MRPNTTKRKLAAGEPVIGTFIGFPSPAMVEVAGYVGFDFVIVDAEHGPMSVQSAEEMIRAADAVGITPIVRIAQNVPQVILRYLDAGALGVQMPMINTRADVQAAANSVKYAPLGKRGLASVRAAGYGLQMPFEEYTATANQETMLITHVENTEAVANLREMVAVDHLDVVFIGPTDLSQSMGFTGRPNAPEVQATIEECRQIIAGAGKIPGTLASDGEQAKRLIEQGFRYLAINFSGLAGRAAKAFLAQARSR